MCMGVCMWVCTNGLKNTKSRDNEAGHLLTQPSSADLVRRDWTKFPLCFDLLQDPLVQRGRRLSLWLQLPSWHLSSVGWWWVAQSEKGGVRTLTQMYRVVARRPACLRLFGSTLTDWSPDCWEMRALLKKQPANPAARLISAQNPLFLNCEFRLQWDVNTRVLYRVWIYSRSHVVEIVKSNHRDDFGLATANQPLNHLLTWESHCFPQIIPG